MRRSTLLAIVVVGAAVLPGGTALAKDGQTTVHCGQTLTHSVKLANDLTDCPSNGLIIGADGITVDLNDHTIDGVAQAGCDFPTTWRSGVDDTGGYNGVTIKGGTVQQFDAGVKSDPSSVSGSRVYDLTLQDNRWNGVSMGSGATPTADNRIHDNVVTGATCGVGIFLIGAQANRVDHNQVHSANSGIVVCCGAKANVIERNSVSDVSDDGIAVFDSGATRIERNVIADTGDFGIWNGGDSSQAIVEDNSVTHTQNTGIMVECDCGGGPRVPTEVRVSGNTVAATASGIWLIDTDRDVVTRNTVTGAGTFGGALRYGVGVLLNGVSDSSVSSNTITDGGPGVFGNAPGILIGLPDPFGPSARPVEGDVVVRNTVSRQGADGIAVAPVARDTLLERNTANRNVGDGIHVFSALTSITRNTADDNGNYGIEAVPNVTDGGNNEANGNGNPAQCTGIVCL